MWQLIGGELYYMALDWWRVMSCGNRLVEGYAMWHLICGGLCYVTLDLHVYIHQFLLVSFYGKRHKTTVKH